MTVRLTGIGGPGERSPLRGWLALVRGPLHLTSKLAQVVHEAFDMLKIETDEGPRLNVRDLGELLYLVTQITFTKSRVAALLKVVDPVYELTNLDEAQCQFVVERVRNVLRAEEMQHANPSSSRNSHNQPGNFHLPGELETPDFECCNCTFGGQSGKKSNGRDCCF